VETRAEQVAELIGAEPREVVFTSGATEANNIAIKAPHASPAWMARSASSTLATEHKCVLESVRDLGAEGFEPSSPGEAGRPPGPGRAARGVGNPHRSSSPSWP
jgi:cysteine sulfinate desulfinase/cysteine desulfurase-like protein